MTSVPGLTHRCYRCAELLLLVLLAPQLAEAAVKPELEEEQTIRIYKHVVQATVFLSSSYVAGPVTNTTAGTGFILDETGIVVSNAHVVSGAHYVAATLYEGQRVKVEVIGIEYASMFAALGIDVTVIGKRDRPLEFLDREIVDELLSQMRNRDVTFRLGEEVERLEIAEGPSWRAVLFLESGKRLVSELVLFCAGRQGATAQLNLPAAGLKADARGRLAVDRHFRTGVPHIFAAGDVIGFSNLATTSAEQGRLAACAAFGIEADPMAPHFPIGIYAMPEISMVGEPEHALTARGCPMRRGWPAIGRSPGAISSAMTAVS